MSVAKTFKELILRFKSRLGRIKAREVVKYGLVTAISYPVLFLGTYLLVEKLGFSPSVAYFVLITIIYIGVYISYTKFVFKTEFNRHSAVKFLIVTIVIWIVNNLFFNFLSLFLEIPYLVALLLNTFILGGGRFLVQRFIVFRHNE